MKTTKLLKITSLCAVLFSALAFSGCNTADGVGKDVERAGEKVQDAAN